MVSFLFDVEDELDGHRSPYIAYHIVLKIKRYSLGAGETAQSMRAPAALLYSPSSQVQFPALTSNSPYRL